MISEIMARLLNVSTDATKTYKHKSGNLRLIPNQEGFWSGGSHKWYVNKMGFPGKNTPKTYDNLVAIIGDSYIQNFMNPDSCRQSKYLYELNPNYNYLELARAGATLLEYFELGNEVDTLDIQYKLLYTSTKDFTESIKSMGSNKNFLQVDLNINKLYYPLYGGSTLKNILYNFKFLYFLYRDNLNLFRDKNREKDANTVNVKKLKKNQLEKIEHLVDFILKNYDLDRVVFVFHPLIDNGIVQIIERRGLKYIQLNQPKNQNWTLDKDIHWSCFGHEQVARQVSSFLDTKEVK